MEGGEGGGRSPGRVALVVGGGVVVLITAVMVVQPEGKSEGQDFLPKARPTMAVAVVVEAGVEGNHCQIRATGHQVVGVVGATK